MTKYVVQVERRARRDELPKGAPLDRPVWKVDEYTIEAADEADVQRQLDARKREGREHLQGVRIRSIKRLHNA